MLRCRHSPLLHLRPRRAASPRVRKVPNTTHSTALTRGQDAVAKLLGAIVGMFCVALLDASLIYVTATRHLAHFFPALSSCPSTIALTPVALGLRGLIVQGELSKRSGGLAIMAAKSLVLAIIYALGAGVAAK